MKVEGTNGYMELRGDCVVLTRKLFFGKSKGEKSIPLASITATQFRPAGRLVSGYLQLAFSGSDESKGGIWDASKDENTILFTREQQDGFEQIRSAIDAARSGNAQQSSSMADELAKLASLRDQGIMTDEEFSAAKARLLG